MKTRVDWVRENCLLLKAIGEEFGATQPFAGRTIGTGIHLEPKTVALLMTLQKGGARVVSTGNLNTTQLFGRRASPGRGRDRHRRPDDRSRGA